LDERSVALVSYGLQLGGKGGDGESVGRLEGAGEEEAGGVGECDEDGGLGALVAVGEVVREVGYEGIFVLDL